MSICHITSFLLRNNQLPSPQTLVYVTIGSHSSSPKPDNELQEWPLWLNQFHAEHPQVPIRIILIDPAYRTGVPNFPFQLSNIQQTNDGSILVASGESCSDIHVMVVPAPIDMDRDSPNLFNIVELARGLSRVCAEDPERYMMVIDAFTGHNLYIWRKDVPTATPSTFLLGSEHNRDSGCFRDFSQPGTGPLIIPDPCNNKRFIFLTPENVDDVCRSRVMSLTPSSQPQPTFTELSLRKWIEGLCEKSRQQIVCELILLLRMFAKIERGVEIADSLDNIECSLERCKVHGITAQGPQDVYAHIRRLISEVAKHYAKNTREFEVEVDTLIATLASEPDIHKFGVHVNRFFDTHFPKYPFL